MSAQEFDGWITGDTYCARYGERRNTVLSRISTGIWERGVHYSSPTANTFFIHEERAKEWLRSKKRLVE